jgi:prepilin-type N-terminal cleavage/methylation domain-containing protein
MINKSRRGFTLVELSLVMAFISLLLLAILISTIHIAKIYAKGVTNRQINQVGRELTDTIRRDFLTADAARIRSYIPSGNAANGRICLGNVSYVWNTATTLAGDGEKIKDKNNSTAVVFTRVVDNGGTLCINGSNGYPKSLAGLQGDATNLLDSQGRSLEVYNLTLTTMDQHGSDGLYGIDITIGTNDPSAVDTGTSQCKPSTDNSSNFEYCSVAEFNITVRAGGDNK